jgi:hypothetical protein
MLGPIQSQVDTAETDQQRAAVVAVEVLVLLRSGRLPLEVLAAAYRMTRTYDSDCPGSLYIDQGTSDKCSNQEDQ